MTTQINTNEQTLTATKQASIGDEGLSFSDYEKLRRGESVVSQPQQSAPEPKKAPEQNTAEESDPAAAEEENSEQDGETESEESESKDGEDRKDKPKKKGGFQRRIDKLNARVRSAEEEREYWRTQALQKKEAGDPKTQVEAKSKSQDGKPNPNDFETHAEYVDALTDWKIDQREAARKADEEKSRAKDTEDNLLKTHKERVKSFAEKTEDWKETIESVDDIVIPHALREAILTSEQGPELMYELAKNREEYERICTLSPLACAREIGKIEARIAKNASSETKQADPNKITKAPKPIDPVTQGKGSVKKSLNDPDLSFPEYERMRREQMKRRA